MAVTLRVLITYLFFFPTYLLLETVLGFFFSFSGIIWFSNLIRNEGSYLDLTILLSLKIEKDKLENI